MITPGHEGPPPGQPAPEQGPGLDRQQLQVLGTGALGMMGRFASDRLAAVPPSSTEQVAGVEPAMAAEQPPGQPDMAAAEEGPGRLRAMAVRGAEFVRDNPEKAMKAAKVAGRLAMKAATVYAARRTRAAV